MDRRRYRRRYRYVWQGLDSVSLRARIVEDIVDEIVTCGRALTQVWFIEFPFYVSGLECGVQDRLHIYPRCGDNFYPTDRDRYRGI